MTLHFDPTSEPTAGFSLLEAMISLAIIALITGVTLSTARPPSASLRLEQRAAQVIARVAEARRTAIESARSISLDFPDAPCDDVVPTLSLFADGTALGGNICLTENELSLTLYVNALTGRLADGAANE